MNQEAINPSDANVSEAVKYFEQANDAEKARSQEALVKAGRQGGNRKRNLGKKAVAYTLAGGALAYGAVGVAFDSLNREANAKDKEIAPIARQVNAQRNTNQQQAALQEALAAGQVAPAPITQEATPEAAAVVPSQPPIVNPEVIIPNGGVQAGPETSNPAGAVTSP